MMRVSLIYGEDKEKAYERFRELIDSSKEKGFEIIQIDDPKKIVGQSLFLSKLVFVLDKTKKIPPKDWKWLKINASKYDSNLLIYNEGDASAVLINSLPKDAKKEKFDLPKIIFTFLDSFYPGNKFRCLKLLNDLVKIEPMELVFHLLARHLRDLYWSKISKESMQTPEWRVIKLFNQANKFEGDKLMKIINELAEMDIKVKTSDSDLKTMLDLLIVERLE